MKNGKEIRPNGVVITKPQQFEGCVAQYHVEGSKNGPWDFLYNARKDADKQFLLNCAECKNLRFNGNKRMPICYCVANPPEEPIVPHGWDGEKFTFWRVPVFCSEDNTRVTEKQQPRETWTVKQLIEVRTV